MFIAPVVFAAALAGTGMFGLMAGNAATHAAYAQPPAYVATAPAVAAQPGCYWTQAMVHHQWHNVQVCG